MSFEHYYAGSQNPEDVEVLESVLKLYAGKPCRFLEIGVLNGQTARGIKQFCDENGITLEYWGIDPISPETHNQPREPFPGAHFVQGDSAESFHLVPPQFDVVLSDGCHCVNHVILETVHYGRKVAPFGFMLFHDTNPDIQQMMRDPHGPHINEFHNSVLAAHALLGFPRPPWFLHDKSKTAADREWGGMMAFRKLFGTTAHIHAWFDWAKRGPHVQCGISPENVLGKKRPSIGTVWYSSLARDSSQNVAGA